MGVPVCTSSAISWRENKPIAFSVALYDGGKGCSRRAKWAPSRPSVARISSKRFIALLTEDDLTDESKNAAALPQQGLIHPVHALTFLVVELAAHVKVRMFAAESKACVVVQLILIYLTDE